MGRCWEKRGKTKGKSWERLGKTAGRGAKLGMIWERCGNISGKQWEQVWGWLEEGESICQTSKHLV